MTGRTHRAPGLRRIPAPPVDPPFDDELGLVRTPPHRAPLRKPATATPVQGTLMLPISDAVAAPPGSTTATPESQTTTGAARPLPSAGPALPNPRRWAARVAQALVEILYGKRPVQQLLNWTNRAVYHQLTSRVAAGPRNTPMAAPYVRSVRVCQVNGAVVEACAVLQAGERVRALAFRLEPEGTRWICTVLDLV